MGIVASGDDQPKSENLQDLILTYRAMVNAMRDGNALILAGQKDKFDMVRYHRLEVKVNGLWPKLSQAEQRLACADLVASGHMPQTFMDALLMFNGKVDMSEPPEPCLKI